MDINDINKMKILAGVPIIEGSTKLLKEEKGEQNMVGRAINSHIKTLDNRIGVSKNREYMAKHQAVASDFEDVLMLIRAGKQLKATKMFNEIDKECRDNFYKTLRNDRVKTVKNYFNALTENYRNEYEEEEEFNPFPDEESNSDMPDDMVSSEEPSKEEPSKEEEPEIKKVENVECPYCDYTCPKENFYDHIVGKHIGSDDEDDINGEEEPTSDPESNQEPESHAAQDQQQSLVSNFGSIGLTFEDKKLKEAAVDATVWNKTNDKDESPSPYPEENKDDGTVKCPKNIKDSLNREIDELQKEAETIIKSDYNTSEFYTNVANAMTEVLNYLSMESEYGMKMAQVCIQKYMSPIVQKFPSDVYDHILRGGESQSITALFKKSKDTNNATI